MAAMLCSIGMRIRIFRVRRALSQKELADRLGVSPQAVSKWETDRACPDIAFLWPLCRILSVSTDQLLAPDFSAKEGQG